MMAEALIPYLAVKDAHAALDFYQRAFGVEVASRFVGQDGKLGFADLRLGQARWFLGDEYPDLGVGAPGPLAAVTLVLALPDPLSLYERAAAAGMEVVTPLEPQEDGARRARLRDPYGHRWILSTSG